MVKQTNEELPVCIFFVSWSFLVHLHEVNYNSVTTYQESIWVHYN